MAATAESLQECLLQQGVSDPRILRAFRDVARPRFLRPEDQALAWEDQSLPIPGNSAYPATAMLPPSVLARMLEALALAPGDRTLELGAGSGYSTALLCELSGSVRSLELCPTRLDAAQTRLRELEYANFNLHQADGREGAFNHAPYDAVLCHFALPYVPPQLLDQLAVGARLVAPIGGPENQDLILYCADENGVHQEGALFSGRFSPANPPKSDIL